MVENGGVTHPKIAKMIGKAYGLSKTDIYELMPRIHRPYDEEYEPDKFKDPYDAKTQGIKIVPSTRDETDIYIAEHQKQMKREHQRRGRY